MARRKTSVKTAEQLTAPRRTSMRKTLQPPAEGMATAPKSVKKTLQPSAEGTVPAPKSVKSAQEISAELKFLEDENYARLKIRLDQLERNIDLSMTQINCKLEAGLSPGVCSKPGGSQQQAHAIGRNALASNWQLGEKISEIESSCRDIHGRVQAEAQGLTDLTSRVAGLGDDSVASKHRLEGEISKLEAKCREILAQVEVENNGQVVIAPPNQTNNLDQEEILALQANLEWIRKAVRTSEEATIENQKELLRHREELNKMQILGKQIANLEKSSRQNQKKVAGHTFDIKSLFERCQSVTQRQDEIDAELKAVKVIVSDLSDLRLSMLDTAVQHQPMEIDGPATKIGAYNADSANLMELVIKKCSDVQETQNHNWSAAVESLKQWVVSSQKTELQRTFEQAKQNSSEIQDQRQELNALKDVKQQDQQRLSERLASMENNEIQLFRGNGPNQLMNVANTESIMGLVKGRCDETLSLIEHKLRADLESHLAAQSKELQPAINQNRQNSAELVQQRLQIRSMLDFKAEIEAKILGLEQARERNEANFCKANSDIHSLKEQNQVISQQQNHIDKNVAELSEKHIKGSERLTLTNLLSKELSPIAQQAKKMSIELSKQGAQLENMAHVKAQIEGQVLALEKASEITQSAVTKSNSAIDSLVASDSPEFQVLIDKMKHMEKTMLKLSNFMDMQMNSCPQNKNTVKNQLPQRKPHSPSSPILIDDGFVTVEEGISEEEGHRSQFTRGSGVQDDSDIEADDEDELDSRRDNLENPLSKRAPQNYTANSGAREPTDEESDSSLDQTPSRPLRPPGKLNRSKKWMRMDKRTGSSKPKRKSLREERRAMLSGDEHDDKCLSNAVQKHIWVLTGLLRHKNAFPRSASRQDLDKLPELEDGTSPVSVAAPELIRNVVSSWDPDEEMGDSFSAYCLRRLKQYGLPFVGLCILRENPKALEWNRRTAAFCNDTFYNAIVVGDYGKLFPAKYDFFGAGVARAKVLIQIHLDYRITEMRKDFKRSEDAQEKREDEQQKDRRNARRVDLAKRRFETCRATSEYSRYQDLFVDERLCSSDESIADPDGNTRIKHVPVWRSNRATQLVEEIDERTKANRAKSRAGRKPGKRISRGADAPIGGARVSPGQRQVGEKFDKESDKLKKKVFEILIDGIKIHTNINLSTKDFVQSASQAISWFSTKEYSFKHFWYSSSFENPDSAVLGADWTEELVEKDLNQHNSDPNPVTFPLDQSIYIDATHETVITAVVFALNLTSLAHSGPLPTDRRLEPRSFSSTHIALFGAQLAAQVLSCPTAPGSSSTSKSIRFISNDAVIPLDGLHGCETNLNTGQCDLDNFITGLETRLSEINYQQTCFGCLQSTTPSRTRFPATALANLIRHKPSNNSHATDPLPSPYLPNSTNPYITTPGEDLNNFMWDTGCPSVSPSRTHDDEELYEIAWLYQPSIGKRTRPTPQPIVTCRDLLPLASVPIGNFGRPEDRMEQELEELGNNEHRSGMGYSPYMHDDVHPFNPLPSTPSAHLHAGFSSPIAAPRTPACGRTAATQDDQFTINHPPLRSSSIPQ
ncbi:hypothetical protein PSHT_10866 [Puccinia striiformis]|uniref:Uncharacterized protein n=1 Tax=Puccinia striiformis TaxID=27350 RepID=A0A2S4V6Y4_9BASI|nr:hypothetical protein PSHT_10866 [Puccinia striiformis]